MSGQLCASFSTAMIRSLRSLSFLSPCSPSITPIGRHDSTHPANAGSSIRTKTSTGSPSSALVEGTNPEVIRKSHARWQYLLQFEDALIGIKSELVSASFRSFDDYSEQLFVIGVERLEGGGGVG